MLNPEPAPRPYTTPPVCVEFARQHIDKLKQYAIDGYDKPAPDHILTGAIDYSEWRRHFDSRIVAKVAYFNIYYRNGGNFTINDLIQQFRMLGVTPDYASLQPIVPEFAQVIAALFRLVLLATMEPELAEELRQQFPNYNDGISILKWVEDSFNLVSPRLVYYKIHRLLKLHLLHKNGSHLQARAKFWDLVNQGDDDVYRDVDLYHAIILMGLVDTEGREFCLDVMDDVFYSTGRPLSRGVLDMARDKWRQRCLHTPYNPLCSVDDATSFDGILSTHPFLGDNVPLVARMSRYKVDGVYIPVRRMPKVAPEAPLEELLGVELTEPSSAVPDIIHEILEKDNTKKEQPDSTDVEGNANEVTKKEKTLVVGESNDSTTPDEPQKPSLSPKVSTSPTQVSPVSKETPDKRLSPNITSLTSPEVKLSTETPQTSQSPPGQPHEDKLTPTSLESTPLTPSTSSRVDDVKTKRSATSSVLALPQDDTVKRARVS